MNKNRLAAEIIATVVIVSLIGLIYNAFSPKPFPIFPPDPSESAVPDSVLFNNIYTDAGAEKTVTFKQVERMIQNPQFQFIDARRPDQFEQGHIGNAVNIFPEESDEIKVPKIFALPKDKIIIVYCDGGECDLSHMLVTDLTTIFGFQKVFIFPGGWEEWSKNRK